MLSRERMRGPAAYVRSLVRVSARGRDRGLAEHAPDMITRHDERGGVLFASPAVQALIGVPARTVLGNGLFERVHVTDRPAYLSALSGCPPDGGPVTIAFRLRRSDPRNAARYVWVEMRCAKVSSSRGAQTGSIVGVTRDISAHKDREAALVRARTDAEQASLAKTQFLANMSHELRTPLNAIIGFSEILDTELFGALGKERYRDYAGLIHESGMHLLNVVNDILDLSKIEAGKFSIRKDPFDPIALVKSCGDIMRHSAEQKGLKLTIEVPKDMPALAADERACKQMLLNVLSNAVKFTQAGGWVKLAASVESEEIVLAVSDNGIGIAAQDLPRLGAPFVQAAAERSSDGAGLGLSVVRGLVRLHGGRLDIASRLGVGTAVRIVLPLDTPTGTADRALPMRIGSAA